MMRLHSIGIGYRHGRDFEIDRPEGSGDDLMLIFKTPAVLFRDGERIDIAPDTALLYKKGTYQHYAAVGDVYINHFLHMDCCDDDPFHSTTGLPFDTPVKLTDSAEAEDIMQMIVNESLSENGTGEEYTDLLIRLLLMKTGRSKAEPGRAHTPPYFAKLRDIRTEIYSSPANISSVDDMAEMANLSPSYFQRLYKKQFGVSCYEDLINARLRSAEYLLKNTDISVKETAESCGYDNDVVFMRLFRQRKGMTPTEYRRVGR
ncbi:MAG: helix-turn-helix transcriptional regulator [Oscillospiraceae bacterium]|nr:helix-turn-helix transcriptional regulator [Oscillospiraceae bacterium]